MNSQFAVRIAVLSGIALVAFAAIFFRLWYLQVLSGEEYREASQTNRVREITVQAPRGEILDRDGKTLVRNRTALSLQVRPDQLPKKLKRRNDLLDELAQVSQIGVVKIKREIRRQSKALPANPVTLKRDVDRDLVYFLREHEDRFPGVTAEEIAVREYPEGTLAAHMFGFVAEINEEQLGEPRYEGLAPGDRIGAAGVEAQYDNALRGVNGATRVQVDALGRPRGRRLSEIRPRTGNNLVLTIDSRIQRIGEEAVSSFGLPASFVVMNVNDGAILGMGSYPTFDPGIYTPPVSFNDIKALQEAEGDPLFNKAIQSGYPTGSTFKAITGTAALEEELIGPADQILDGGSFEFGGVEWINAGKAPYGSLDITRALQVSSDIFFYKQGIRAEDQGGEAFQKWAKLYGFGSDTGIDLPGEGPGFVPTEQWRNDLFRKAGLPDSPAGPTRDFVNFGETDRQWSHGDNMNLAVGQGDLKATPLQLAVAYAALANGGQVVRPHVAQRIEDPRGQAEEEFTPAARRELPLSKNVRDVITEGLRRAAMEPSGTSYPIFGGYPFDIAGKTGTAETPQGDQSWYAAFAPFLNPEIVVVATIERGGFGADAAAPAVDRILRDYFKIGSKQVDKVGNGDPTLEGGPAPDPFGPVESPVPAPAPAPASPANPATPAPDLAAGGGAVATG